MSHWYSELGRLGERLYAQVAEKMLRPLLSWEEHKVWTRGYPAERTAEHAFAFKHLSSEWATSMLDVGSGESAFPALVALGGIKVRAIDPFKPYWRNGNGNRHWRVHRSEVWDWQEPESVDVVTLLGVIEHTWNDVEMIQAMALNVKVDGLLIVTCPFGSEHVDNCDHDPRTAICQVYDGFNLEDWVRSVGGKLVDAEYWRYFSGSHHLDGERFEHPYQCEPDECDYAHFAIRVP